MRNSKSKTAVAVLAVGMVVTSPIYATVDGDFLNPVRASTPSLRASVLEAYAPVADQELGDSRGGFDVGGVSFNFGATVQTLVNGQIALQTNIQYTPAGAVVTQLQGLGTQIQTQVQNQVTSALNKAGISSGASSGSNSAVTGTPTVTTVTPTVTQSTSTTPAVIPAVTTGTTANTATTYNTVVATSASPQGGTTSGSTTNINTLSGIQIQSPTGTTDVLAGVGNGQIQNVVLNTASNQNIVQNTNIVLTIYNFAAWQQQLAQHSVAAQITNQMLATFGH